MGFPAGRVLALAAIAGLAGVGPLEDAAAAHERGDDATAVRLRLPLAEGGDGFAEFALGFVYDPRQGNTSRRCRSSQVVSRGG